MFDSEDLVTLLELQGQELTRLQNDLKIKEESELSQIKELIKKCENHWKQLHSQIIRKLILNPNSSDIETDKEFESKKKLFTLIRFQIQNLYSPISLPKDLSEGAEEKNNKFTESLCKGLMTNMVTYFKMNSNNSMVMEPIDEMKNRTIREIDQSVLSELKDSYLDLYWLEHISLNLEQVQKSKSKKQAPTSKTLNIKFIMSMNNQKKSFKEFLDFAVQFGAYYDRYFLENEAQDTDVELVRNFGRLIYLFTKGFTMPGRHKLEDLRITFMTLLKAFRIPQIVPKILSILKENLSKGSLLLGNAIGLREELTVMVYNIYKMLVFTMLSLDFDASYFSALFKTWVHLCSHLYGSLDFLRANRLLHLLMHKPAAVADSCQQYRAHEVYFDYEVKLALCTNALNIVKAAHSPADLAVKMAEKELLQLYRCLYCRLGLLVIPVESIRAIDRSVHEGDTQEVIQVIPDYCVIPNMDAQQEALTEITPAEAQLMIDMLSHFFLSKMETDVGTAIKEKLDLLCKPKQQVGQNKRQVLEFTIPSKIKKSLQKIVSICFETMKQNKDEWMIFPEAKALMKRFPEYLDYRQNFKKKDMFQDLEVVDSTIEQQLKKVIKEGLMKAAGIDDINISMEKLELLHQTLNSHKTFKAIFPEYVYNDGEVVERTRIKQFLRLAQEVCSRLDRSSIKEQRNLSDTHLNMKGVMVLTTLFMHFNDQERSGTLLADGANLAAESMEKLTEIAQNLSLYENVGALAISCSLLMESPIWFFHNLEYQIKVLSY